jgi:RNA polymerase sigma-70 factor (ECF subfamily)
MLTGKQEQTFRQWIEEHKGVILKVVRANAADAEDQKDLFQEVACQVWMSIPSFQEKSKVSTWIYKVALNTSLVWHRAQKKQRHICGSLDDFDCQSGPWEDPSRTMEDRERLEWLYEEIRKLPKVDRSLVLLYLDEFSYRDIADILGMSTNHVGVKLNRIKKHLAESYTRRPK